MKVLPSNSPFASLARHIGASAGFSLLALTCGISGADTNGPPPAGPPVPATAPAGPPLPATAPAVPPAPATAPAGNPAAPAVAPPAAQTEPANADTAKPDAVKPDAVKPDAVKPDTTPPTAPVPNKEPNPPGASEANPKAGPPGPSVKEGGTPQNGLPPATPGSDAVRKVPEAPGVSESPGQKSEIPTKNPETAASTAAVPDKKAGNKSGPVNASEKTATAPSTTSGAGPKTQPKPESLALKTLWEGDNTRAGQLANAEAKDTNPFVAACAKAVLATIADDGTPKTKSKMVELEKLIKENHEEWRFYFLLGISRYRRQLWGPSADALSVFTGKMPKDPNVALAYEIQGDDKVQTGDFSGAEKAYGLCYERASGEEAKASAKFKQATAVYLGGSRFRAIDLVNGIEEQYRPKEHWLYREVGFEKFRPRSGSK